MRTPSLQISWRLTKPRFTLLLQFFQSALHFSKFLRLFCLVCIRGDENGRSDEDSGASEGKRNLEKIPTFPEYISATRRDVKAQDRGPCRLRQDDRSGLRDKARSAGSINGESGIQALAQTLNHFHQSATRAPRA